MNNKTLGAHEVLELHEVLNDTINGINQFHLYQPHCSDSELRQILNNQINFMTQEYNQLINLLNQAGDVIQRPAYKNFDYNHFQPSYGMDTPQNTYPKSTAGQITDSDIANGMLSCHKSSAVMRMTASLEFADPKLRNIMTQGAKNCSDQAFEIFQYMNRNGLYQVPYLTNQETFISQYKFSPESNSGGQMM